MYKLFKDAKKSAERLGNEDIQSANHYLTIAKSIQRIEETEAILDYEEKYGYIPYRTGIFCWEVRDYDELHHARVILRNIFGSWSDKITSINHLSGTEMYAHYLSDNNNIMLDFHFEVDNLPEGLLGENCHIEKQKTEEKTIKPSEYYSVVCESEEKEEE